MQGRYVSFIVILLWVVDVMLQYDPRHHVDVPVASDIDIYNSYGSSTVTFDVQKMVTNIVH